MELSIEVVESGGAPTFICRGRLIRGRESDYLFDLVTRPGGRDVVLDVEQLHGFDKDGLSTIELCHELLSLTNRRLFLCNASKEMLLKLYPKRLDANHEIRSARPPGAIELAG
jgi:anti-anti-sigma regulatory factor